MATSEALTVGNLGLFLQDAILRIPSSLGRLAHDINKACHRSFDSAALRGDTDLLPLPYVLLSADDMANLHTTHVNGEKDPGVQRWKCPTRLQVLRLRQLQAWVFCMIVATNYLYVGFGWEAFTATTFSRPLSLSQQRSIERFYLAGDYFMGDNSATLPGKDWSTILEGRRLGYDGEVVAKAMDLSFVQVVAALPPEDLGGSIDALDLCDEVTRNLLLNPEANMKPREEWPPQLAQARMRISDVEWLKLAPELVRRRICGVVEPSDLIVHNGRPLLSGMFGVSKGKTITDPATGAEVDVLRLIINLVPSNELQLPIVGDVSTLPHFAQWIGLELLPDEKLAWSAEDIQCAFYIFRLPPVWMPWFALGKPLNGAALGLDPTRTFHLALQVIPMGWLSAVGCCQMCLRRLITGDIPLSAGLPLSHELRKDRRLPTNLQQRVLSFHQEYIDNWDAAQVLSANNIEENSPGILSWQADVRDAYASWGVPRSVDKSSSGHIGETLGARIDGERGWIGLGTCKAMDLAEQTLFTLQSRPPSRKETSMLTGRWIFAFQFRRTLMVTLMRVFDVINLKVPAHLRLLAMGEELMTSLCFLPLLGHDLRNSICPLVTCSDASETGGGVCASTAISPAGHQRVGIGARTSTASRVNGICLVESFAGISGGRRALEILGVTPMLHVHFEIDEGSLRVVSANYPDAIGLGDVTQFTEKAGAKLVRDFPGVTHVVHTTSPPCQQVTGLNPMGAGVHGDRSGLLFQVPKLRKTLRRLWPDCVHADLCEMVSSLSATNQEAYDKMHKVVPLRICPSSFTWIRRPRLYWIDWDLCENPDVKLIQADRWSVVKLSCKRPSKQTWLPQGWKTFVNDPTFPTCVRATAREKPPFMPAGLESLQNHELQRYKRFHFIYPPYQFQDKYMVVNRRKEAVPLTAIMREILMGFEKDATHGVWPAAQRRSDPVGYALARCSLLGNTFRAGVVAWLLGQLLFQWDYLEAPALVAEIADPGFASTCAARHGVACSL